MICKAWPSVRVLRRLNAWHSCCYRDFKDYLHAAIREFGGLQTVTLALDHYAGDEETFRIEQLDYHIPLH